MDKSAIKTYRCPVCNGQMFHVSGNANVKWHECEVCHSYLVTYKNVNSKEKLQEVKVGKKTSVLVSNPDVAKILQKEQP